MNQACMMERFIRGDELDSVGIILDLGARSSMRTSLVVVHPRLYEAHLQLLCSLHDVKGRLPVCSYITGRVYTFAIAGSGEGCDLRKYGDKPTSESEKTIYLVILLTGSRLQCPIISTKERLVVLATTQAAKDVEIGKPSHEEVEDFVLSGSGCCSATAQDHLSSYVQMLGPRYRVAKCIGIEDLERGQHNGRGQAAVGDLPARVIKGLSEGRKHILNPVSNPIGWFRVIQHA